MYKTLEEINEEVKKCTKCGLCQNRKNTVYAEGNIDAKVMIIGEGPGEEDEKKGLPFVGKSGQLMNQALQGLGIDRNKIYITNIVKCRPPNNRTPLKKECESCLDYLRNQVLLVKPEIIVLMGNVALKNILGDQYGITASRGKWIEKKGIKYMPTFHPAALLRDESKKIDFWNDLKLVLKECEERNIVIK